MRIGLDLRMLGGGSGISRYISELSHEILRQDKINEYVLFFKDAGQSTDYKQYNQKINITNIPHYSFAEQFKLPKILNRENLVLVHFPHFNVPIFYRKPFVVTIHDLTHTKFPGRKKSHFFHRLAYNIVILNAVKTAKKIIAISQSTRKELMEYFGIQEPRINVVYEGTNEAYKMMDKSDAKIKVFEKYHISKPYILFVGVWRRYKNLPNLSKAFDILIERGHDFDLVLAGPQDPFYPEIKEQVLSVKNKDRVNILGSVMEELLPAVYNAAELLVQPSFAEGFGLTPLEAASCGVPVACSDIPTLREVMGQAAVYFDPTNIENMVDILEKLLKDERRREELANLGLKRASLFSWKKAAEETVKLYETVAG